MWSLSSFTHAASRARKLLPLVACALRRIPPLTCPRPAFLPVGNCRVASHKSCRKPERLRVLGVMAAAFQQILGRCRAEAHVGSGDRGESRFDQL